MGSRIVIALGGNAILQSGQEATYENQIENVQRSMEVIARIINKGHTVVITHGNGPQVGNILRRHEEAKHVVPAMPLDVGSAESQGFIGYMIEQSLRNELQKLNNDTPVTATLTQTEVSKQDPGFQDPTKPIGIFYSEEKAKQLAEEKGWIVKEDAGRGWRRVVASPEPKRILGSEAVRVLSEAGAIVVTTGGGGVPVIKDENGQYQGIDAVIDKDRSGFKLAQEIEADMFMILTDVENVYVNYGKPNQKTLHEVTLEEVKKYMEEDEFAVGSMKPKVESAIKFAEIGGRAIICSLDKAEEAMEGKVGTHFVR